MGNGASLVTCLAVLALGQGLAHGQVEYLNQRECKIPIVLTDDPVRRAEIRQLFLFVSTDEGKTWRQEAVAAPTQEAFPFFAPKDGIYWFNVSIMDKNNQSDPPDVSAVPPAMKMVVDTRAPMVRIAGAERWSDQVSVSWELQDDNLDLASLHLEYRLADSPTWYMVPISPPTVTGQKRWTVSSPSALTLRLRVQDAAGNAGQMQRELPSDPYAVRKVNSEPLPASPAPPAAPVRSSPFPDRGNRWEIANPPASQALSTQRFVPAAPMSSPPYTPASQQPLPSESRQPVVIAESDGSAASSSVASSPAVNPQPARAPGPVPALDYINNMHFDLDYEVTKVGPGGLGVVELWMTQDNGKTWQHYTDDQDLQPPFGVQVSGEGQYGFTLIVRNRAGLGKQTPTAGSLPDIRVEIDTTLPAAKLFAPEADPNRKDQLMLLWTAYDRNLTATPITLQWSDKVDGPWQLIASSVANSGKHIWQMPAQMPYEVYLRMDVQDLAGNIATVITPKPVLVDLVEPVVVPRKITVPAKRPM
jgi:hypothetical protein